MSYASKYEQRREQERLQREQLELIEQKRTLQQEVEEELEQEYWQHREHQNRHRLLPSLQEKTFFDVEIDLDSESNNSSMHDIGKKIVCSRSNSSPEYHVNDHGLYNERRMNDKSKSTKVLPITQRLSSLFSQSPLPETVELNKRANNTSNAIKDRKKQASRPWSPLSVEACRTHFHEAVNKVEIINMLILRAVWHALSEERQEENGMLTDCHVEDDNHKNEQNVEAVNQHIAVNKDINNELHQVETEEPSLPLQRPFTSSCHLMSVEERKQQLFRELHIGNTQLTKGKENYKPNTPSNVYLKESKNISTNKENEINNNNSRYMLIYRENKVSRLRRERTQEMKRKAIYANTKKSKNVPFNQTKTSASHQSTNIETNITNNSVIVCKEREKEQEMLETQQKIDDNLVISIQENERKDAVAVSNHDEKEEDADDDKDEEEEDDDALVVNAISNKIRHTHYLLILLSAKHRALALVFVRFLRLCRAETRLLEEKWKKLHRIKWKRYFWNLWKQKQERKKIKQFHLMQSVIVHWKHYTFTAQQRRERLRCFRQGLVQRAVAFSKIIWKKKSKYFAIWLHLFTQRREDRAMYAVADNYYTHLQANYKKHNRRRDVLSATETTSSQLSANKLCSIYFHQWKRLTQNQLHDQYAVYKYTNNLRRYVVREWFNRYLSHSHKHNSTKHTKERTQCDGNINDKNNLVTEDLIGTACNHRVRVEPTANNNSDEVGGTSIFNSDATIENHKYESEVVEEYNTVLPLRALRSKCHRVHIFSPN